jgi:RAD51-like protein 2
MSATTPLAHLPLRSSTLSLLQQRGFSTVKEIEESKSNGGLSNLAYELQLSLAETAALVREVQTASSTTATPATSTALSLLQSQSTRSIITFSKSVDNMLGGGVSFGEVTEVCGLPGAGKTQLAMQLCVNANLPENVGGVCGQAVYIDTEGSFSPERCQSMATALVQHVHKSTRDRGGVPDWFEPDSILDSIHVFRVYDEATQMATLEALPQFLEQHQQQPRPIRVVVLDSIAFHYRSTTTDYLGRTRSLSTVASMLSDMATKYNLAVVVANQMTTKVSGDSSKVVPALGESWAHAVTTRLIVEQQQQQQQHQQQKSIRSCRLVKSPHKPCGVAYFDVRESGIRDIPRQISSSAGTEEKENQEPKRQRTSK